MSEFPKYSYIDDDYAEKSRADKSRFSLRRMGRIAMVCAISLMGAVNLSGDSRIPEELRLFHEENEETVDENISIMTANVRSWDSFDGSNFEPFIDVVEERQPDIICMQEVLSEGEELSDIHNMGYNVYFNSTNHFPLRRPYGNAIASKAPITDIHTVDLPSTRILNPRNAISFTIETEDVDLDFTNTHLDTRKSGSHRQLMLIDRRFGEEIDFSCGDFNQSREEISRGPFSTMLDRRSQYTSYMTYPSSNPNRQIDHILTRCGLQLGPPKLDDFGSDHLAMTKIFDTKEC